VESKGGTVKKPVGECDLLSGWPGRRKGTAILEKKKLTRQLLRGVETWFVKEEDDLELKKHCGDRWKGRPEQSNSQRTGHGDEHAHWGIVAHQKKKKKTKIGRTGGRSQKKKGRASCLTMKIPLIQGISGQKPV